MRQRLLAIRNQVAAKAIMQEICASEDALHAVLLALESEEKMLCQRASWPLTLLAEHHSEVVIPHLKRLIALLDAPVHNTIVRNICRLLAFLPSIPEEYEGQVYDLCFPILADPKQAVANRVFSMTACTNIAVKYPDLAPELIAVINMHLAEGSAGFKSRGRKEIARLKAAIESSLDPQSYDLP